MTILTPPARFVVSLSSGEIVSGNIGHKDYSQKGKRIQMNG